MKEEMLEWDLGQGRRPHTVALATATGQQGLRGAAEGRGALGTVQQPGDQRLKRSMYVYDIHVGAHTCLSPSYRQ